jgi:hypothetical protein
MKEKDRSCQGRKSRLCTMKDCGSEKAAVGQLIVRNEQCIMTFHEPHEMLPKEKKVKIPLPTSVEWSDGNGNVRMKPRELNEKDREELSFLFNPDYEMSMGEERGWKGGKQRFFGFFWFGNEEQFLFSDGKNEGDGVFHG